MKPLELTEREARIVGDLIAIAWQARAVNAPQMGANLLMLQEKIARALNGEAEKDTPQKEAPQKETSE